ncbi:hypothetical protein [Sphingomonas bacterium]|uniref:hypothetical protein n=1 Tax=Sphingomonas bacterium TaxID=1895847 RepID=UPI002628D0DA|nr:hypothetical protein [Sphingomonas bacterium]MDB5677108.1 hypothetical protein [Sphingomonas bacterium]
MINSKIGRTMAYAVLALGAGLAAASPANATGPEPIYDIYYYDDASHTTLVGHDHQVCYYFGIGYDQPTDGTWTQYSDYVQYGTCDHGVLGPL